MKLDNPFVVKRREETIKFLEWIRVNFDKGNIDYLINRYAFITGYTPQTILKWFNQLVIAEFITKKNDSIIERVG